MLRKVLLIFSVVFFAACGLISSYKLTDALVQSYIKAYASLKAMGVTQGPQGIQQLQGTQGFGKMEKIVKEAGFKDFREFLLVNFEIGKVMSLLQSNEYITQMQQMSSEDNPAYKSILEDPDVPESSKEEVRKQLAASREEFNKQKTGYADPVLNVVKRFTSKENYEVVVKYQKELLRIYTGI